MPSGGLDQTGEDAMVLKAGFGSCAERSFPEDDQMPDGLLGMIIGRRHTPMTQKRKKILLIITGKIGLSVSAGFLVV